MVDEIALLDSPFRLRHLRGEEVQVLQHEIPYMKGDKEYHWYTVQILRTGEVHPAGEHQLQKLPSSYLPSKWENCLWKPKK